MWLPPAAILTVMAVTDGSTAGFDPYALIGQAPAAAVCVLFMLDKIHGPGMKKDRDEARRQLADLNQKVIDDIVPAITRAADAVTRARRRGGDG